MTKVIVKTTGDFELNDMTSGAYITNLRPHVVPASNFVAQRAALGQLELLASDLPDEADDEEFAKTWKAAEGDQELALASYQSEAVVVEDKAAKKVAKAAAKKVVEEGK